MSVHCQENQCLDNTLLHSAHQTDGYSPLSVIGEIRLQLIRDILVFYFKGLVVENLYVEVLAGIPFIKLNDI